MAPSEYSVQQKKELVTHAADFTIITGHLYNMGAVEVLQRYILEHEQHALLAEAHDGVVGGHYVGKETAQKARWKRRGALGAQEVRWERRATVGTQGM